MDNEIPNPPRPEARGCAGKGCLTVLGLAVFLVIALIAGTFWGVHYLRGYSAAKPLALPVAEAEALPPPPPRRRQWKPRQPRRIPLSFPLRRPRCR